MATIEIGVNNISATNTTYAAGDTVLNRNPADRSGMLTQFEIYFTENATGVKIGTFYGSGTSWTNRDYETIGSVTAGAKRTYTGLDCDVSKDDRIGAYWLTGTIRRWYAFQGVISYYSKPSDQFGTGTQTYSKTDYSSFFLYGLGTTILKPTVTTGAGTSLTSSGFTGNGNITSTGGENATRRGVCYIQGTTGDPTTSDPVAYDDGDYSTGAFTKAVTGLTQATSYRVRAYAVNTSGTGYGTTVTVTTLANAPTVTTQSATSVSHGSLTGNGNITATGGENATTRGFCYIQGTSGTPTVADLRAFDTGSFNTGAYVKSITGLSPGLGYRVRAYAINSAGTSYGATVQETTTTTIPTVVTEPSTDITGISFTGNGAITALGGENATRRGVCYKAGTSGDPTIDDFVEYEEDDYGTLESFSVSVTGLTPGTSYRVRAYVTNTQGTGYGVTEQILTLSAPTVTTQTATDVTATAMIAHGNITVTGGANATTRGFCYIQGSAGDPDVNDDTVYTEGSYGTGTFEIEISDLDPSQDYRVRAYAINLVGTSYGDTVDVTTEGAGPATVTTQAVSSVTTTGFTGNGNITNIGGSNPSRRGFCYKAGTSLVPTISDLVAYEDGSFNTGAYTKAISGLLPGTSYRVRAYAVNTEGLAYGATVTGTTSSVAPTVQTTSATNILSSSVVGNGGISNTGGSNATRRGFCYIASRTGDPTTSDPSTYEDGSFTAGVFSLDIQGLIPNTQYRIRAYAVNPEGTSYGITLPFRTFIQRDIEEPGMRKPLDDNTPDATHVAWVNSRFVANHVDTNYYSFTDTDPFTFTIENNYWSSTDNPVACDYKGDKLAALFTSWQEIYAWGTQGLQVFQDDGVTPFVNVPGAASEVGLEAVYSVKAIDNTIYALCVVDNKRVVIRLQGRTPQVISEPIANVLSEMSVVSDAIADVLSVGGMAIYLLNFPTANQTWAYDYKSDVWLRWGYWNRIKGSHDRFLGQHACFVKKWNKHLIMSSVDGKIYEMSRSVFSDAGNPMVSYRRTGWLDHGNTSTVKHSNELTLKVKTFANDGVTSPKLLLRWRDDGYPIWSNYVHIDLDPAYFGDFVATLSRMGQYRSRQYEFRLSDEVDMALVNVVEKL